MWQIVNPVIQHTTLDFGTSGQSAIQVSQLLSNGILLVNALELVDWDEDKTQFLVCEACGFTHCKSGDWISLRTSGSLVLILPAFESIWEEEKRNDEYAPPHYIKERGIPYLDLSTYENLRSRHTAFPPVEKLRRLNMREAILLFQWEAPAHVLGELPEKPVCRCDMILGASEGEHLEHIQRLEAFIQTNYHNKSAALLRPCFESERKITLYLDAYEFIEWKALAYDEPQYRLLLNSEYVIAENASV